MNQQQQQAADFHALHVPGQPLILFNIWDPGSARAVEAAGAKALATGSWSVAHAFGFEDGEQLPITLAIDNLRRICKASRLPVSIDLESGYGADLAAVSDSVARAIQAGAIGCNLEDSYPDTGKLRPVAEQVERIAQAQRTADAAGIRFFINARTDVFFQRAAAEHDAGMLADAVTRARAYAEAGASGLFAPGLVAETLIGRLTESSPLPVNLMVSKNTPGLSRLSELKVARVSHGPGPFVAAMKALEEAARRAL